MVSRWVFSGFVLLLAAQRLLELVISRRNERKLRAAGGIEYGAGHYRAMTVLHGAWLLSMLVEVWLFNRPLIPALTLVALILFAVGQTLRYTAILTLGWRWNVRVLVIPGVEAIRTGIYRYVRHPNYLGVALEIFSAPILHTALISSILFSILNAVFLKMRISVEEKALRESQLMRVAK
jgi:methyltransferase